jgi:hypothetical protein
MGHLQPIFCPRIVPKLFCPQDLITLPRQISWYSTRPLSLFHKRTLTPLSKNLHPHFPFPCFCIVHSPAILFLHVNSVRFG